MATLIKKRQIEDLFSALTAGDAQSIANAIDADTTAESTLAAALAPIINLNDLADVDTSGVASGDVITFDGSAWVVGTASSEKVTLNANFNEALDGSNKVFTINTLETATDIAVYLNGQKLTSGSGKDFIITGTNQITLDNTFTAPDSSDELTASFSYNS